MTRLFRGTLPVLCLLMLLPACSLLKKGTEGAEPVEPAQVTIHNRNVLDVNVYALRGAERIRLGMIVSGQTEVFVLDEHIIVNAPVLRFVADPIGSPRSILIEERAVFPGDEVQLWVPTRRL